MFDMNLSYHALDNVDYVSLGCGPTVCNHSNNKNSVNEDDSASSGQTRGTRSSRVMTLSEQAARAIVTHNLTQAAVEYLPAPLMYLLLRSAIKYKEMTAVSILVCDWPLPVLSMKEAWPEGKDTLFEKTMLVDTAIFVGLMKREESPHKCKLKCMDLTGYKINEVFSRVLIGSLPLLSLKAEEREHKKLAKVIIDFLASEGSRLGDSESSALSWRILGDLQDESNTESLEQDLRQLLLAKIGQFRNGYIYVPPGEKLEIRLDSLHFGRESAKLLEYLMMGALRDMMPVKLNVANLYVETSMRHDEQLIDSCSPFLALVGQEADTLQGLSLNNIEDMLFQVILRCVAKFSKLQALDIGNCNISITGKTRMRSALRSRILYLFSQFTQLTRLDIQRSELTGNLGTLLNELKTPLEYLNVSSCCLNEDDLESLAASKHGQSLKEIHLSSLVRLGDISSPDPLLTCIENLGNSIAVIELQNNEIGDEHGPRLCEMVPKFTKLKLLDVLYNFMSQEMLLRLVESASYCKPLHCLAINLLPIFGTDTDVMERRRLFQNKCTGVLERCRRRDICLIVVAIGIE